MSEYELMSLAREHIAFMMSVLQWWAGITLGVLVAVHVIGSGLNGYIASILAVFYSCFTVFVSTIETAQGRSISEVIQDFDKLQQQGVELSTTTLVMLQEREPAILQVILGVVCFWGLFLSTIAYIIYCYRINKQQA
jgi:hypothetical protein